MEGDVRDERFAPPQANVDDVEAPSDGLELATRGTRLGAAMIDGAIAMVMLWLLGRLTPFNPWIPSGTSFWSFQITGPLAGLAIFIVIHGYLLVTRGQTVGKALLKIRIVRPDGSKVSPARIIGLRYCFGGLLSLIPALAQAWGMLDVLFIFRSSRRCLHDLIADTIVVRA